MDKKVSLWVAALVFVLVLAGAYMFTPNLRSALKLMKLDRNPAVEAVNIVLAGEVNQVGAEGFVLANGGDSLEINTNEQTKFSKSWTNEDISNSIPYTPSHIANGNQVRINAFIWGGKIWAKGITFVGE